MTKYYLKLFSLFLILYCLASSVYAAPEQDVSTSINASLERLSARYRISFQYENFPPKPAYLKFDDVASADYPLLDEYLVLFEKEISKYPSGFFKDEGVRGIGLVMRLFNGEVPAQGLYSPQAKIMFFDIARFRRNKAQQRHSIHHEIFHMMFEQKSDFDLLQDDVWAALNSKDFSYGKQKRMWSKPNPYNYFAPNQPGFVTYYAMTEPREDQAEVFAVLMQDKHRKLVEDWANNDEIIAKKIEAMKQFVQYYHSGMNEGYWNN